MSELVTYCSDCHQPSILGYVCKRCVQSHVAALEAKLKLSNEERDEALATVKELEAISQKQEADDSYIRSLERNW